MFDITPEFLDSFLELASCSADHRAGAFRGETVLDTIAMEIASWD
jgi:hypothetical protein